MQKMISGIIHKLGIICIVCYIVYLQALRRKEKEYELEMQRMALEKITLQGRITDLKEELAHMNIEVDLNQWITIPEENDTNSTSTATGMTSLHHLIFLVYQQP